MAKEWKPSKTWARKAKKAINKLMQEYQEKGEDKRDDCSLCKMAGETDYKDPDCDICPWRVFNRVECVNFDGPNYYTQTIPQRLRRLRSWIKKCDNIINKEAS